MRLFSIVFALFFISGTAFAQDIQVEAFKKLNHDFSKYKTFYWSSQVDQKEDPGFYFLNDLVLKGLVRESVEGELEGLGYEKANQSPDLLVNFRVFDKPTSIKGYTGYGTTYWGDTETRDEEDATTYEVKAGTLVVNLVDRQSGLVVWTGFASGLMDGQVFNKDEIKIKEAVNLVFEEYNQRADGISSN